MDKINALSNMITIPAAKHLVQFFGAVVVEALKVAGGGSLRPGPADSKHMLYWLFKICFSIAQV